MGGMSDIEFMIHVLNNFPEENDVVLDLLVKPLNFNCRRWIITGISQREKLNSRLERIISTEREKDCSKKALAAEFNVQFKGTFHKCDEYGHNSDSPKCPEN